MTRVAVLGTALAAICVAVVLVALDRSESRSGVPPVRPTTESERPAADPLPAPPALGLAIPEPVPLSAREGVSLWAPVLSQTAVRSAPSSAASTLGRVSATTPEGTENIVLLTGDGRRADETLWVRIRAAGLEGWIPRRALGGYESVDTRLRVDTRALTATLVRGDEIVFRAPIGIGTPDAPTPTGDFYVRNVLTRYRSPTYGPIAFGTSAQSETLTDWPAGGFVGIHGTDRPELLPGRVSHGCIRLRNEDIVALARLMPVGTPMTIT